MAIITVGNVEVVVRTRDEHCPPHVHADCQAEGWSARFTFSFADDDVSFWDFQPKNPKRPPSMHQLDRIGVAVSANLTAVRFRWWQVMRTTCLRNRYVITKNGAITMVLPTNAKGGSKDNQIIEATYVADDEVTRIKLKSGEIFSVNLRRA